MPVYPPKNAHIASSMDINFTQNSELFLSKNISSIMLDNCAQVDFDGTLLGFAKQGQSVAIQFHSSKMPVIYLLGRIVHMSIAFLYPAYMSYKALRKKDTKVVIPMLTYWIVIALFSILEFVADIFVFWVPFYYVLKTLFVIWLISPPTKGHLVIYKHFVHPTFKKHEKKIDEALSNAQINALRASTELGIKGMSLLQDYANEKLLAKTASTAVSTALSNSNMDISSNEEDQPVSGPTKRTKSKKKGFSVPQWLRRSSSEIDQDIKSILDDLSAADYLRYQ